WRARHPRGSEPNAETLSFRQPRLGVGVVEEHDVGVRLVHAGMARVVVDVHTGDRVRRRGEVVVGGPVLKLFQRRHVDRRGKLAVMVIGKERARRQGGGVDEERSEARDELGQRQGVADLDEGIARWGLLRRVCLLRGGNRSRRDQKRRGRKKGPFHVSSFPHHPGACSWRPYPWMRQNRKCSRDRIIRMEDAIAGTAAEPWPRRTGRRYVPPGGFPPVRG